MHDCPYCQHSFSTKQRLISHLTRNNKCYDVAVVGVPKILMELMGFNDNSEQTTTSETSLLKTSPTVIPVQTSVQTPVQTQTVSEPALLLTPLLSEPLQEQAQCEHIDPPDVTTVVKTCVDPTMPINCPNCLKPFATQRNLDRHTSTVKCHKKVIDDNIPLIYKSKNENTPIPKPVPTTRKHRKAEQSHCIPVHTQGSTIKYIIKENYFDTLTEKLGSHENTLKYIKSCIQSKMKGGINLLYKVYCDGKDLVDIPIEVIDIKTRKIYYKTPDNIVLDENSTYIKSILIENLRNCYLHFCNQIISDNMSDNDVLFDDYDLGEIQKHILELSEDKRKDKIIGGLLEHINKIRMHN